jgi:uncharacterized protein (DUF1800 family)
LLGTAALALSGCGGGKGGGGASIPFLPPTGPSAPAEPTVVLTAVTVVFEADAGAVITVNGQTASGSGTGRQLRVPLGQAGTPADPGTATLAAATTPVVLRFDARANGASLGGVELHLQPSRRRVLDGVDSLDDKRHLLDRTGFGARAADLARHAGASWNESVELLLDGLRQTPVQSIPGWRSVGMLSWRQRSQLSQEQRDALQDSINDWSVELRAWWIREMLRSPSPFTERLVLFWHGLWTSSLEATPYPHLMLDQNLLMRRLGTTDFAAMAHALTKDPAMVLYLDSDSNVKESPNENFARELMELFSLGEGRDYAEADIPEIARAFTGYNLTDTFTFAFRGDRHDYDPKTYFGQTWNFSNADESSDRLSRLEGDQVVDAILAKERCSIHICEKLWDEFVGLARDDAVIAQWATTFRASNYRMRPLLREMLLSDAFRSARGVRVKSPAQLILAPLRSLGLTVSDQQSRDLVWWLYGAGQGLMMPPNVRGWAGGNAWVDAEKYLRRRARMGWLVWNWRTQIDLLDPEALDRLLLEVPPLGTLRTNTVRNQLYDILSDPAYQLS